MTAMLMFKYLLQVVTFTEICCPEGRGSVKRLVMLEPYEQTRFFIPSHSNSVGLPSLYHIPDHRQGIPSPTHRLDRAADGAEWNFSPHPGTKTNRLDINQYSRSHPQWSFTRSFLRSITMIMKCFCSGQTPASYWLKSSERDRALIW